MIIPQLILVPGLLIYIDLWSDKVTVIGKVALPVLYDVTWDEILAPFAEYVLAQAEESLALVGFWLGGIGALEIMHRSLKRVGHYAILDTRMLPENLDCGVERIRFVETAQPAGHFHGFGKRLHCGYLALKNLKNPAIADRVRDITGQLGPEDFIRQSKIARPGSRDWLANITCPTLVLRGEDDSFTAPAQPCDLAIGIRNSRRIILPSSGHLTPVEPPGPVPQDFQAL